MIQETDDYPYGNRTTPVDVNRRVTRPVSTTTPASTTDEDEEVIYLDKSDNEFDDGYNEDNYPDTIPPDQIDVRVDPAAEYSDQDDSDEDGDDENYDDIAKRRRRWERSKGISPRTEFQKKKSNQL